MKHTLPGALHFGGLEEIRTPDPHNANVVRSQLRYKPVLSSIDLDIIHLFFENVKRENASEWAGGIFRVL